MSVRLPHAKLALACACVLALTRAATGAPRPAADSTLAESPAAPLITTPRGTATAARDSAGADTAVISARRRAREEFGRGLMLEEARSYAAAIISYYNAAKSDPTLRGPSYRIGLLLASRQQWEAAGKAFREELRRDPGNLAVSMEYSLAICESGDTARAIRRLEALTRRAPGDARMWRALGFAYGRAGRYAAAEKALRGSVRLDPKNAKAWRDLGVVLAARDRFDGAREAYRRALAIDPTDESALINLANLESRAGEHERALGHYHDAERRDSTQADAYRGQVRELVTLGRETDAGAVWRRWLAVAQDDPEVRESAARHFVHVGRGDAALEIARAGVRAAPRSGEAWWLLGEMQAAAGEWRDALESYATARPLFKEDADRTRVRESVATLRARAPDSLARLFQADSALAARADTTRARRPR